MSAVNYCQLLFQVDLACVVIKRQNGYIRSHVVTLFVFFLFCMYFHYSRYILVFGY